MPQTNMGSREADKRKLPIEEMYALGETLVGFIENDEHDKAKDLCVSFYRTLGVYADSEDMKTRFYIRKGRDSFNVEITFTFPRIAWGITKYLYLYRDASKSASYDGAMLLQDLFFALQGAIDDAAVRIFMPLVGVDERKRIDSALYYALCETL
jgi:hypothetical protein